ncbi:MAG TPA: zinc-binding dehydrogenase [Chloroflexota bacterium]|nr:zinc-binding dehydrogenase [Chloroflexota bacterium]
MASVLAAVKVGPLQTELREFPMPEIPDDAGLLQVLACGVCGADVHDYQLPLEHGPFIMGHENVGRVARIGGLAARRWGLREGDRIALEGYQVCGHCPSCLSGYFGFCPHEGDPEGARPPDGSLPAYQPSRAGGFSQYLYLRPNLRFHKVPEHVPDEHAALAIPFGNGWQWAYLEGGAGPGKTVLIQGPGQQGLGCLVAAREAGAERVIVAGLARDEHRLEVARKLGADATVDVEREDLREQVLNSTAGAGVDVVIDVAAGTTTTVLPAIDLLKVRGTLVVIPARAPIDGFPMEMLSRKCLSVKGARGHSYTAVEMALRTIASSKYPLEEVANYRFSLAQVHDAIGAIAGTGPADAVHVSVHPWR